MPDEVSDEQNGLTTIAVEFCNSLNNNNLC